jgi:ankyrin repeat protein
MEDQYELVELLVKVGLCKVDTYDHRRWTALTHACFYGQVRTARLLVEEGADIHVTDKDGAHRATGHRPLPSFPARIHVPTP